jgi:hypothetical protein
MPLQPLKHPCRGQSKMGSMQSFVRHMFGPPSALPASVAGGGVTHTPVGSQTCPVGLDPVQSWQLAPFVPQAVSTVPD